MHNIVPMNLNRFFPQELLALNWTMRYTSNVALLRSKMGVSNFLPIILAKDVSS
jgi:hypothetical protein